MDKKIWLKSKAQWVQDDQWVIRNRLLPFSDFLEIQIQEITLGPETEILLSSGEERIELILPLLGEVTLQQEDRLILGNLWTQFFLKPDSVSVKNSSSSDSIHALRVCLPREIKPSSSGIVALKNLNGNLVKVWESGAGPNAMPGYSLFLTKLLEHEKTAFQAENPLLAMPLTGVFEIQDCSLEQGDCLQIFKPGSIELKCLASEGMILILEVKSPA